MTIALIDGDIIRYSVGFAAEGEPLAHCLHSVKKMLNSIIDSSGADDYTIYLSGPKNFREEIATIRKYKGNRKDKKPTHFDDITKYLKEYWKVIETEGQEADDIMGITQCSFSFYGDEDTVICSLDKDLLMIPGRHYRWPHHGRDGVHITVTEELAMQAFYGQLLTGDSVDNIEGCKGVGPKGARKIIDMADDEEDLYWLVLGEYAKKYPKPFEVMLENARLLWIRREPEEMWEPKW